MNATIVQQLRDMATKCSAAADAIENMVVTQKNLSPPGVHIQKVEIVVTSNQEPSRIAREVRDQLSKKRSR